MFFHEFSRPPSSSRPGPARPGPAGTGRDLPGPARTRGQCPGTTEGPLVKSVAPSVEFLLDPLSGEGLPSPFPYPSLLDTFPAGRPKRHKGRVALGKINTNVRFALALALSSASACVPFFRFFKRVRTFGAFSQRVRTFSSPCLGD